MQHNTATKTTLTNLRFTYTYRPLSDFIVVYSETRVSDSQDSWRALTFKFTRLLQF